MGKESDAGVEDFVSLVRRTPISPRTSTRKEVYLFIPSLCWTGSETVMCEAASSGCLGRWEGVKGMLKVLVAVCLLFRLMLRRACVVCSLC